MKIFNTKRRALTLPEVMTVIIILSFLTVAGIRIYKSKLNYITKVSYYSAFMNLKQGVGNLIAVGYNSTKALDPTGSTGFCPSLTALMNTIGAVNCTTTVTSGFGTATPNFITTNGARHFFGTLTATSSVPYTIYVDINGTRGDAVLNVDVMPFTIALDGTVLPVSTSLGATSTDYLSASVGYRNSSGTYVWVDKGVPYYTAVCDAAGTYNSIACSTTNYTTYCKTANTCEVLINKPGISSKY